MSHELPDSASPIPSGAASKQEPSAPAHLEAGRIEGSQPPPLLEKLSDQTSRNEAARRPATGPRTARGKKRSRVNPLKHGVLSKFALLDGESREEYLTLWNGLHDYFQPQGIMEYICVEDLTIAVWRKRRLIAADTGTISEKIFFIETKMREKQAVEALQISGDALFSHGLVAHEENPVVIEEIIDVWKTIRQLVTRGHLSECSPFIEKLYGANRYGKAPDQFSQSFENYCAAVKSGEKKGDPSRLIEMMQVMIAIIDRKIDRFSKLKESHEEMDHQKMHFKKLSGVIPSGVRSDLLLRYEVHLSREMDRILNRLERLQRMRKGQELPPRLDVNIS
jgi:hypothetical protein